MIAIIQARMSSNRLPKKSMMVLRGKTILQRVVDRVNRATKVKYIIIATSKNKSDLPIHKFCKEKKIECFKGDLNNVYKRLVHLVKKKKIKQFVRICADSPFIDPRLIDKSIIEFEKGRFDIVTNVYPRSFPKGQSIEVIKTEAFIKDYKKIKNKNFLEHVTTYFYQRKGRNKFKIKNIRNKKNLSKFNLSIDTMEDFKKAQIFLKRNKFSNKTAWEKILSNY
tara:strand:- start:297 stop:965 length:669 start_codon:yes stop_codon:yes gene_type:complete